MPSKTSRSMLLDNVSLTMRPAATHRRRGWLVRGAVPALALILAAQISPAQSSSRFAARVIRSAVPMPVRSGSARFVRPVARSRSVGFTVALQPPHPAQEAAFLQSLQDRNSSNFHRYLTPAQWNARFAPTSQTQRRVAGWLRSQGLSIIRLYPNRLIVDAAGRAQSVGRAFGVHMGLYRGGGLKGLFYSNDRNPTVPPTLSALVQNVVLNDYAPNHGLSTGSRAGMASGLSRGNASVPPYVLNKNGMGTGNLSVLRELAKSESGRGARSGVRRHFTSGYLDPVNLWSSEGYSVGALYNQGHCCNPFHNPTTGTPADTSIAIATACPFLDSDLGGFSHQYGMAWHWQEHDVNGGPGANDNCKNANDGGRFETSLDVEYSTAMSNSFGCACDTSTIDVFEAPATGVGSAGDPRLAFSSFFDIWEAVLSANADRVMSMSWGGAESAWGTTNEQTGHNILSNLAGIGITSVSSTGDDGAYESGKTGPVVDLYPSADTEMLAAGGTQLQINDDGTFGSETTWNSGGGGCSTYFTAPGWETTAGFDNGCSGMRSQPDVSLNGSNITLQALYFNGTWYNVYGTSEVAPELAGIFAQFNAYLLSQGSICGSTGTSPCEPLGLATPIIWHNGIEGTNYSTHYPFYDVTTGNNDDGTGTGTYPAKTGYDLATGWGSINALQLYRLFAWYVTPDYHPPIVTFSGPPLGQWYNYNVEVSWTVTDPVQGSDPSASGVAGYSDRWDVDPGDPTVESTPGCCNPYWNGPEFPNSTTGKLELAGVGTQGCHTVNVEAWDNLGRNSRNSYGALCYDTVAPSITSHSFSPPSPSHVPSVKINAAGADPGCPTTGSCMSHIVYWVNTAADGTINGRWVQIGSSAGASGSAVWKTNTQFNSFFGTVSWDAGTHYVSPIPWDRANNAVACAPSSVTNPCLRYVLDRPDWPQYRGNTRHTGFNGFEKALTTAKAPKLKRTCAFANSGIVSPASIYDGVAYVGSKNGKVYAIDSRCRKKWTFTTGGAVLSSPDVTDGSVYVGSSDGKVYALKLSDGTLRWSRPTGGAVISSPVVTDGFVYVGSKDHNLYSLFALTGAVSWKYPTGGVIVSSPAIANGLIFVGSNDDKVYAITATGALKWTFKTGGAVKSSPALDGGRVFVGSDDRRVYALRQSTGKNIWAFATGGKVDSSPAVNQGRVLVGSSDGRLYSLGEATGHKIWAFPIGGAVTSAPALAGSIAAIGAKRGVIVLRTSDGTELFSDATGASAVSLGNGRIYIAARKLLEYQG
jgi:outer membrane protein assembly factor BamB